MHVPHKRNSFSLKQLTLNKITQCLSVYKKHGDSLSNIDAALAHRARRFLMHERKQIIKAKQILTFMNPFLVY